MVGIRTISTISPDVAQASLGYLIELMLALRSYKKGIVLVGGWVPYLLLRKYQPSKSAFRHVGSQDIDLAVNPKVISQTEYADIEELVKSRGYQPNPKSGFSFLKPGPKVRRERLPIQIDFLGPEYGGIGKKKRHQRIQDDFLLRKARGADFAFDHVEEYELTGTLPNGSEGQVSFYIADIVGSLVMKGITLGSRHQEKDAYDLFVLVTEYKEGPLSVATAVKPYQGHTVAQEAITAIKQAFRSREAEGPGLVADFFEELDGEVREQRITDVYMQVKRFLEFLKDRNQ